jgi:hypothetical protein
MMNEDDLSYSDLGLDHAPGYGLLERYGFSSEAYNEIDEAQFIDAGLGDLPPLLEPSEALGEMDAISTSAHAAGKGKGREVDVEAGTENREGMTRDKGKGRPRDKGKGKARASPYPDYHERLLRRTSSGLGLPPLIPSYITSIGGCTDDAMGDLLAGLRPGPSFLPDNHFPGDPSGCGVPHHDDD